MIRDRIKRLGERVLLRLRDEAADLLLPLGRGIDHGLFHVGANIREASMAQLIPLTIRSTNTTVKVHIEDLYRMGPDEAQRRYGMHPSWWRESVGLYRTPPDPMRGPVVPNLDIDPVVKDKSSPWKP